MQLVFYSPRFYPLLGGLERVVEQWADYLVSQGVSVAVITDTKNPDQEQFSFPVFRNISWLKQWQLMRSADAVLQFNISLKGLPIWFLSGRPLIISHHTLLFPHEGSIPLRQKLKLLSSDRLPKINLACSHYVARQFKNCSVVFSPYNATLFNNFNLPRPSATVIFVGRLVSDKGADLLIDAIALLRQKKIGCRLTIIGEGPEEMALTALVKKLNLSSQVFFRGKLEGVELAREINRHQIMVVPSRVEPFGITVLEGLACGCQILVSNTGGLSEALGGFGRSFAAGDIIDLANKLDYLLNEGKDDSDTMVQQHLQGRSIESTGEQLLKIISLVINA